MINFHEWTEEKAKTYPDPYAQVYREVKPERARNGDRRRREIWWRFTRPTPELYAAITGLERVIVITRHTKTVMPVMVPTGQVMSDATVVFASGDTGMFALLSSAPHYWWAISRASTLETRIRYTPSDVFETLPLPEVTAEMRECGGRLDTFRRELMLARTFGLTDVYNLVHDQGCVDADIAELREIHRAIDEAVVRAYGWDDLLVAGLDHCFHETRQGPRYTIAPAVRQEVLDRLLELNQERYTAEVAAGLHTGRGRQRVSRDSDGATLF